MKNLFRVFDKAFRGMRNVKSITWLGDKIREITFEDGFGKPFSDELIVLQSTGIKDSSGKMIFEGDILKHDRLKWRCDGHPNDGGDMSNLVVISWDEEEGQFRHQVYDEKRCFASGNGAKLYDDRAKKNVTKIIGNIYENRSLLPKGK